MLKVMSDFLVLKDVKMFQNESHYIIELEYKNLNDKFIKHTFEYHNYDNAINDFLILSNSIKGGR